MKQANGFICVNIAEYLVRELSFKLFIDTLEHCKAYGVFLVFQINNAQVQMKINF